MSSNVSNAMAGSKPPPLQILDSNTQTTAPTPDQRLSEWNASLDSVGLSDARLAQIILKKVAHGTATTNDALLAQSVFNDLIQHEAYDVFVEVFTAYNAIRAAQVRAPNEPPFKTSLTLELPANWAPTGPAAFHAALQKVQVQKLEVVHPTVDESKFMPLNATSELDTAMGFWGYTAPSHADTQQLALVERNRALLVQQHDAPVPEAVCDAIVTLLQAGTTELSVRGNLAQPSIVAQALSASPLESIELGHVNRVSRAISPETSASYGTLMQGLAKCRSLRQLVVGQPVLLALHAAVEGMANGCPNLKSIQVKSPGISDGEESDLASFMKIAAQCEGLEEVVITNLSTGALSQEVYGPLSKLPTLTTLDLEINLPRSARSAADWNLVPEMMRFSKSCPSLKHVKLNGTAIPVVPPGGSARRAFSYLNFPSSADWAMTEEFLLDPTITLATLTVSGVPIPHLFLSAVVATLPDNKTLTAFDISGCVVSANATFGLPEALIHNDTLRTGKLPTEPSLYFMVSADNSKHALAADFQLNIADDVDLDERQIAITSYKEISAKVKLAPTATQAMLDHRVEALEALTRQVGGVMQMAAPPSLSSIDFRDIATHVLPHMAGNAQELRNAVRLSEVGLAADPLGLHSGNRTPDSLKAAVNAVRSTAVVRTTTNTTATTTTTATDGGATATPPPDGSGAPNQV
ncbi:hypothetical protein [Hydrogenophaga sp.]|uniref:hypothetical protein n=1 Tax=Hydrogenophaga sp. TaxID=1904254 RepID=UPI00272769A2|nr:hypothetical protein [Hydrogenophaga sp.]MDO9435057.1 hypothetical protein [Hydrogenophaga sp.]